MKLAGCYLGLVVLVCFTAFSSNLGSAPNERVKVGVATILSGDFAVLGKNIQRSVDTYQRYYLRHPVEFSFEDAKKGSADGLRAYRWLVGQEEVDLLIGGTTSNGTVAAAALVNQKKVPLLTPLTGGSNIDRLGPYVFRIGNSDIKNGIQQAEVFLKRGFRRIALVTEQTEYTSDIADHFRNRLEKEDVELVLDQVFAPESYDFRSLILRLNQAKPDALFMATQTGLAFGVFLRRLSEQGLRDSFEIHTNFVAATNSEAHQAAGEAINGIYYLAPSYDAKNPRWLEFLSKYEEDHGVAPAIEFHTAGTFDGLELLQIFLDRHDKFDSVKFRNFLLSIEEYSGLMGKYRFDAEGNTTLGFVEAQINNNDESVG